MNISNPYQSSYVLSLLNEEMKNWETTAPDPTPEPVQPPKDFVPFRMEQFVPPSTVVQPLPPINPNKPRSISVPSQPFITFKAVDSYPSDIPNYIITQKFQNPFLASGMAEAWKPQKVGSGEFKDVFCADLHMSEKTKKLALLVFKKSANNKSAEKEAKLYQKIVQLNLKHFPKLHEVIEGSPLIMVTKFCNKGTVNNIIESNSSQYDIDAVAFQMIEAVAEFHQNGILHHDIHNGNFLIHQKKHSDQFVIYLTDIGLALTKNKPEFISTNANKFTLPPEGVATWMSEKHDSWTLGLALYQLYTKTPEDKLPWNMSMLSEQMSAIKSQFKPDLRQVPKKAKKVIEKLLATDPNKRITPTEAKNLFANGK